MCVAAPKIFDESTVNESSSVVNISSPSLKKKEVKWKPAMIEKRTKRKFEEKLKKIRARMTSGHAQLLLLEQQMLDIQQQDHPPLDKQDPDKAHLQEFVGCNADLPEPPAWQSHTNTAIVDAGASHIYVVPGAPVKNVRSRSPRVTVGTASGEPFTSSASCELNMPDFDLDMPLSGYVMPGFAHNLVGIGEFCDRDCMVKYTKKGCNNQRTHDPGEARSTIYKEEKPYTCT